MKERERATVKKFNTILKALSHEQRDRLLWIGEGMAIATKGANYAETDDKR